MTAEEIDRLPKSRSFQSIAMTAPSVNSGEVEGGFQVAGASGAENAFTVDGIVTNSLINGQSRQNTVFEYLQELRSRTSGIADAAHWGVSQRRNQERRQRLRGESHYYFEGSAGGQSRQAAGLDPVGDKTAFAQDAESPKHQRIRRIRRRSNRPRPSLLRPTRRETSGRRTPTTSTMTPTTSSGHLGQQAFGKLTHAMRRGSASWSTLWTPSTAKGTLGVLTGGNTEFVAWVPGRRSRSKGNAAMK